MKTFVIGDVHGCKTELVELIQQIDDSCQTEEYRIVFLGDLVHKGPDAKGVVETVRNLIKDRPGSVCLAGNHEELEIRKPIEGLSEDDTEWLKSLPIFHQFDVNGKKYFAVHAGITPSFSKHYPEGIGEVPAAWHKGGGVKIDRLRRWLRVRFVNPAGDMVAMGQEKPEDKFWATVYGGEYGFVLFGHSPSNGVPMIYGNAIGLDTGCVFGNTLTAYCVETDSFLQVQAKRAYAELLPNKE